MAGVGLLVAVVPAQRLRGDLISADSEGDHAPETAAAGTELTAWLTLAVALVVVAVFLGRGWHRLPERPRWSGSLPGVPALAMAAGMLLLGWCGASLAGAPADPEAPTLAEGVRLALGNYTGQAIVAVAYAVLVVRLARPPDRRAGVLAAIALGVAGVALVWPVLQSVSNGGRLLQEALTGESPPVLGHETLVQLTESPRDVWFFATLGLVVIGPAVLEEVLYRGMVQRGLRDAKFGGWPSIAVSSVFFVLMHTTIANAYVLPPLFVLSLLLGWCYEKTGRLLAPMVLHGVFNAANLAIALSGHSG